MLILFAGLPGTGKSTLARELSTHFQAAVLDKDLIRAALFAPEDVEYSAEQDDFCMDLMLRTAEYLFSKNPDRYVFLDGRTFSRHYQRDAAKAFAKRLNLKWRLIECVCDEEIACQRLRADELAGRHPAANRNCDLYHTLKTSFEPIGPPKLLLNTGESLEVCLHAAQTYLSR